MVNANAAPQQFEKKKESPEPIEQNADMLAVRAQLVPEATPEPAPEPSRPHLPFRHAGPCIMVTGIIRVPS